MGFKALLIFVFDWSLSQVPWRLRFFGDLYLSLVGRDLMYTYRL